MTDQSWPSGPFALLKNKDFNSERKSMTWNKEKSRLVARPRRDDETGAGWPIFLLQTSWNQYCTRNKLQRLIYPFSTLTAQHTKIFGRWPTEFFQKNRSPFAEKVRSSLPNNECGTESLPQNPISSAPPSHRPSPIIRFSSTSTKKK